MADSRVMQREKSSAELRKINKPLVEKRRRERINSCLETLKTLILDATKKDTIRYSKLEKADILEMTVKHLRDVARSQHGGFEPQTSTITKYRAGFNECATEVTRYLAKDETLSPELRMRLLNHLASRLQNVNTIANAVPTQHAYPSHNIQQAVPTATPLTSLPGLNFGSGSAAYPAATAPPNPTQVPMLVPTRLPNGQIAYVLSDSQKANIKAQQQQAEMITSTPVNKKVKSEFFDMNLSNVAGTPPQSSIRGMDYRSFIHRSNMKRRVSDRSSLGFSKSSLTDSTNQSSFVDSGIELDDSSRSFKAPKRLTPRASATISSPPLNSSEDFSAASVKTDSLSISPTGSTAYSLISSPSPKSALSENLPPKRLCVNESDNDSLKLFDEEDEQEEVDPGYDDPVPRGHDQDQDSDLDHNGNDALAENMNLSDANDSTGFRVQDHDSRETNETSEGISREGVNYNVYAHNLAIGGAYDDHGVWRPW